jgi:teichuronic acid biosynthesis glycosyltransferase TuaG
MDLPGAEMSQPIISIVMPAFNSTRYLREAVQSLQQQTWPNWELLVVDGGSRDGTQDLVKALSAADPRVRLIPNPDDKGPAHARCTGVRHAKGKYVGFLDADDIWLPTKIEDQVSFMERAGVLFTYARYSAMSADGSFVSCPLPAYSHYTFRSALALRGIGTLTVVVHRECLTEEVISNYGKSHGEDYLWWLMVLRSGVEARLIDKNLAHYRQTAGSLSTYRFRHQKTVWHTYRNEMGLGRLQSALFYTSYMLDVAQRRLRTNVCSKLRPRREATT